MLTTRHHIFLGILLTTLTITIAACGGNDSPTTPDVPPQPAPPAGTADAFILPGASTLGGLAFGQPPLVVHKGERLHWVNLDNDTHALVADTPALPEFVPTGNLPKNGERSFVMNTVGTTPFHCTIHPSMVGTLVVQ